MKYLLTISILFTLIVTQVGCDKMKSLEKAERASKKVATYANEAVNITRELYRDKTITDEQALKATELFVYLARGGKAFDSKVAELKKFYAENNEKPNKKALQRVAQYFRANVIERFIEVLEEITQMQVSDKWKAVISGIKTAILIVADSLNVGDETRVDLAGVA